MRVPAAFASRSNQSKVLPKPEICCKTSIPRPMRIEISTSRYRFRINSEKKRRKVKMKNKVACTTLSPLSKDILEIQPFPPEEMASIGISVANSKKTV